MGYPKKLSVNKNIADSKLISSEYYKSNQLLNSLFLERQIRQNNSSD